MMEMPEMIIPTTVAKYCDIVLCHSHNEKTSFRVNLYDEGRNHIKNLEVIIDSKDIHELIFEKLKKEYTSNCHRNETVREFFNRIN